MELGFKLQKPHSPPPDTSLHETYALAETEK